MSSVKFSAVFFCIFIQSVVNAQDSCLLDGQWTTPTPTIINYGFGGGWITGIPDPTNSVLPSDSKGIYEAYSTADLGGDAIGAIRVGLGSLDDANDNTRFQVTVYDDDGSGAPGAFVGGTGNLSPTAFGVPGDGFFNDSLIQLPTDLTPSTATFHVGVEIFPGDPDDILIVMTSCLGPPGCASAEGDGDASNHIFTTGFGYENLLNIYGADFDVSIIPRLVGPDSAFTYPNSVYLNSAVDPVATINGVPGGTFTATPATLVIDASTGEIDLSASPTGDYNITYSVTTNCTNSEGFNLRIEADATIGDFVWNDLNGNGTQDGGEPGLSGVTVYLDLNTNGTLDGGEPSDTTDGSGAYDITGLATGTYSLQVDASTVAAGFTLTTSNLPLTVNLAAGEDFNDADFGYQQQNASIGDFVWNDLNGNGTQDGGEPGLSGLTVYLDLNSNGVLDGGEPNDSTDGAGAYDIRGLATGTYSVQVDASTVAAGFTLTTSNLPQSVNLAAGEDFNDADFGYQQQNASIGDFVWNDLNGNGIQEGGEPGLSGVTVYLDLNSNGALDGGEPSDTTDGSGAYDIADLATGTYSVQVDASTLAAGFTLTTSNLPQSVNLAAGEDFNDADFGYQQQNASIGDFVWNDLNGNGIQEGGEPGLSGVTVYLDLNSNGALDGGEPSDTTDGSGIYDITGLAADAYSVRVDSATVPTGFNLTTANLPTAVNLTSGEDFNGADFGYQLPIEISINDVDGAEGNSGVSTLSFEVTLSQASQGEITVDFATSDLSATQNIDYTPSSGTLTFAAGVISQPVDIEILGDFNIEPNETFSVELTNPTLASIDDDQGIGTINDDDLGADLSVNLTVAPTDAMVGETVVFTMQINNAGPDTALDVMASLDLQSSFAYVMSGSTQGSCQNTNGLVECDLGDVTAGQMIESTVTATLLQSGGISITANVNSAVSDDNNQNNNSSLATFNGAPVAVPVFSWFGLLILMVLMAFLTIKTLRPKLN